jgi:Protein of unknown function (DUF4242)
MPTYCLELYLPRASAARLDEEANHALSAADAIATDGIVVHYVRTTYLAEDETCFHFFEADSAEDVAEAMRRAGLPSERITRAVEAVAETAQPPVSGAHQGGAT